MDIINSINKDDTKNKYKKIRKLNFGKLIPIDSNNFSSINEDSGPYITNKNFYPHKKFDKINNINETNKTAPILKLSEVETLIETSRESS